MMENTQKVLVIILCVFMILTTFAVTTNASANDGVFSNTTGGASTGNSNLGSSKSSGEIIIAYDDGQSGGSTSPWRRGMIYATRFTPPSYPFHLTKARFYVMFTKGSSAPLIIHVMNPNHNNLIAPFIHVFPLDNHYWYDVDLSSYGLVIESGDFYIGFEHPSPQNISIGTDTDTEGRSEIYGWNLWDWEDFHATWMLRAVGFLSVIDATINIDPDTLNLKSKGRWITAYITLSDPYHVNDIDISSVMLEDTLPAEWGDVQNDTLMVKFDRAEVEDFIGTSQENIELTITGELANGTQFEGSDAIRVIEPGK
ncbi:MAG: hypothetical protein JSW00_05365 [Thermoplasmata archaeon]|nr:MAG: hypothetical protein JSW00_05365 [Thermoplasmata archaeon]